MKATSDELKSAADALPGTMQDLKGKLSQSAQDLQTRADGLQAAVDSATALSQRIAGDSAAVASEVKALDETAQKAAASPSDFADTLFGGVAASANTTLSEITLACDGLAVSIANFDSTVKQSKVILGQVNGVLDDCTAAFMKFYVSKVEESNLVD